MIGSLIEEYTNYEYDYKFYAMQNGVKYGFFETVFIYSVFFVDLLLFFGIIIYSLFFLCLGIAYLLGYL